MLGTKVVAEGYGDFVRAFLTLSSADNAIVAGWDSEQVQQALGIIADLFESAGLRPNTTEIISMVCIPGRIKTRHGTLSYRRSIAGVESTVTWQQRQVSYDYDYYHTELMAICLYNNM